jgi:hypothetical protein
MSKEKTGFVYVTYIRSTMEQVFEAITIEFSIKHDNRFDAGALYL